MRERERERERKRGRDREREYMVNRKMANVLTHSGMHALRIIMCTRREDICL